MQDGEAVERGSVQRRARERVHVSSDRSVYEDQNCGRWTRHQPLGGSDDFLRREFATHNRAFTLLPVSECRFV